MKVKIISKPNQKLKYVDPDFETEGVDEDDYEYIYCEDFFNSGYAEDCIANSIFDYKKVLLHIEVESIFLYFHFSFLDIEFQTEIAHFINSKNTYFQTDIIGNLAETGNWFFNSYVGEGFFFNHPHIMAGERFMHQQQVTTAAAETT